MHKNTPAKKIAFAIISGGGYKCEIFMGDHSTISMESMVTSCRGTVGAGGARIGDIIHDLHAIDDLTEYGMGKIQVEGAAYLGVFFGNLGGIFLYILRRGPGTGNR